VPPSGEVLQEAVQVHRLDPRVLEQVERFEHLEEIFDAPDLGEGAVEIVAHRVARKGVDLLAQHAERRLDRVDRVAQLMADGGEDEAHVVHHVHRRSDGFEAFALGDVAADDHEIADRTGGIAHRRHRSLFPGR
jgi:hypothetical protein